MAATYTVKSGDTLGAIASTYGTNVGNITGYKSGNPNLIYPGEVLTIGGGKTPTGGGGGSPSAPGYLPLPKAPKFTKATQFTGEATKEVAPLYDPQIQTTKGQLPLLQKRYDLYLADITTAGEDRRGELETKQLADVSRTSAAAGTRGLRGSYVESQVRGVSQTYEKLINTLTTDITSQKTELGINRESSELELRGMIASLVGQKASKIMELSRTLSNTTNEQRMQAFTNLLSLANTSFDRWGKKQDLALSQQELNISKQSLALAKSGANKLSAGELSIKEAKSRLTSDVKNIKTRFSGQSKIFPQLVGIYSDSLTYDEILSIYNKNTPYGPAQESYKDVIDYLGTTESKSSKSDFDRLLEEMGLGENG